MRISRWYCPESQTTFSLLPDCLSARLGGSLDEVEWVVVASEFQGVEAAARSMRLGEVELPGMLRWLRRRCRSVRSALLGLMTAVPGRLGTVAEVRAVRGVLGTDRALVSLREIGTDHLHALPHPIGFCPPRTSGIESEIAFQHGTGTDPPSG